MQMQQPDNQTTDGSTVITRPQRAHFSAAALPVVFSSVVLCNDSNFFFMIDTARYGGISISTGMGMQRGKRMGGYTPSLEM